MSPTVSIRPLSPAHVREAGRPYDQASTTAWEDQSSESLRHRRPAQSSEKKSISQNLGDGVAWIGKKGEKLSASKFNKPFKKDSITPINKKSMLIDAGTAIGTAIAAGVSAIPSLSFQNSTAGGAVGIVLAGVGGSLGSITSKQVRHYIPKTETHPKITSAVESAISVATFAGGIAGFAKGNFNAGVGLLAYTAGQTLTAATDFKRGRAPAETRDADAEMV